jgi:multidrug resistance efflux pump
MENPQPKKSLFSKPWLQSIIGVFVVALALGGFLYWKSTSAYVSIENSQVSAPVISIGPESAGILSEVYVKAGDIVVADKPIARVGSETLYAKVDGIVLSIQNTPGQLFMAGSPVVSMIDPNQLRIVGKLDEDKGLSQIKVNDPVTFTVDAFGGQVFQGLVDEISPTSDQSSVVFSISDKREVKQFDIKIRYDIKLHPEFKNGMSAKVKVYDN